MKLNRPLILLALAAVLPLTVVSAALGVSGLRQQQASLQSEAESRVQLASTLVERELMREVAVVSAVTQAPVFDGPLDQDALSAYLDRLLRDQRQWRVLVVSDPAGGRLAYAPHTEAVSLTAAEMDSHRLAVFTRAPVVGRIMRRPSGLVAFAVRAPVIRGGKVVYVVSAILEPDVLRRLLLTQPLPADWRAGVLDASGRVVVRINAPQEAIGGFASPDALRSRAKAASGFAEAMSLEGEPLINAFKVLPGFGWSVHAALPLTVYRAPVARSLWLLAAGGVASLVLAGLFLWLLARELRLRQRQGVALEEARRMEALGRMTGGVAHDFNNLLMIVQGSAEMLKRRRTEPDRVAGLSDAILSAAQRGQSLTRQLLAFARRGAFSPVDFRFQDRAPELTELIRRSLRDDIAASISVPPDTWPLHADPDALEIALINLAVNARDAMPNGGLLSITASNLARRNDRRGPPALDGDYVLITVRDSGEGIPSEHIAHIFEPFYTTKASGKGTGLGLSQVYGFARQSGGAVTVVSRPGEGAAFTLYLPRAPGEPVAPQAPGPEVSVAGASGRLLLIEGAADVALATQIMLEGAGYAVVLVPNGEAAVQILGEGSRFDGALCDSRSCELSTAELVAALRGGAPDLAVVLMTADPDDLAEAPGQVVLLKPFGPDQVRAALREARGASRWPVSEARPRFA